MPAPTSLPAHDPVRAATIELAARALFDLPTVAGTGRGRAMRLSPERRRRVLRRLAIARGHLGHVGLMLEQPDVDVPEVLSQIRAIEGALSGVRELVWLGLLEARLGSGCGHEPVERLLENASIALRRR